LGNPSSTLILSKLFLELRYFVAYREEIKKLDEKDERGNTKMIDKGKEPS
jgi:hypothetical protein